MKNPYQAYSSANYTVPKTKQVVMLYDEVIRNLNHARDAIASDQVEVRYNKLVRASEIIAGLQMSLDFDQGQETAAMLYDLYSLLESRIVSLHRSADLPACDALIQEIKQMRELWHRIDVGAINADGTVHSTEGGNGEPAPSVAEHNAAQAREAVAPEAGASDTVEPDSRPVSSFRSDASGPMSAQTVAFSA